MYKELNSVNNYMRELGNRFPPVKPSYETADLTDMIASLVRKLEAEAPSLAASAFLIHKNCETINVYCFKRLRFEGICYTVITNTEPYFIFLLKCIAQAHVPSRYSKNLLVSIALAILNHKPMV